MTAPPGDSGRLFVVEQSGRIRVVQDGALLAAPFLDIQPLTGGSGSVEYGMLGMAFHPQYATNGHFYVYYTSVADANASVVARYTVDPGDANLADPASAQVVLGPIAQPYKNHNGGNLQFGPDGKLYLGLGDGGSQKDPECRAQQTNTLLGKLLRLEDDGSPAAGNPFAGDPTALDEIWATGLRNPWRFSFDRLTGDLYIGDAGQNEREEISFQPAGSPGGENYGWKLMEGTFCFGTDGCPAGQPPCNDPSLVLPIVDYSSSAGAECAAVGGYVYRGCAIPDLQGTYFYADYCTARVWSLRYDGTTVTEHVERTTELAPGGGLQLDRINSFGEDADGELYLVDRGTGGSDGEVYRIVAAFPAPYEDLGFGTAGGSGAVPALDVCGILGTGVSSAVLRLREAAPSSAAVAVISTAMNPLPILGGTLVPALPTPFVLVFATDAGGELEVPIQSGSGPLELYVQLGVLDPGAAGGVAFSNAIRAVWQP